MVLADLEFHVNVTALTTKVNVIALATKVKAWKV